MPSLFTDVNLSGGDATGLVVARYIDVFFRHLAAPWAEAKVSKNGGDRCRKGDRSCERLPSDLADTIRPPAFVGYNIERRTSGSDTAGLMMAFHRAPHRPCPH